MDAMTSNLSESILSITSVVLPLATAITGVVAALIFVFATLRRVSRHPVGGLDLDKTATENISRQVSEDIARGVPPQNALMREYHAQGLSQSKISFWFSLIFASLGFAIIALSIGLFLQRAEGNDASINSSIADKVASVSKPLFTLVAGTVIDAVAALFFVQSNKARQLMVEFFDKLRVDRKLDEALSLIGKIEDPVIASRVKSIVALSFSDVVLKGDIVNATLFDLAPDATNPKRHQPKKQIPLAPDLGANSES
jgi:hypothetical protein